MSQDKATVIHPSAVVESGAKLGSGVSIGPFCHVGPDAVLGDDVELISHVVVMGATTIGEATRVFPQAVLGAEPQNTAYKGERTTLTIGRKNTIREGVTMHIGTGNARGETIVGDNCMFLAYAHVAHDCILGNNVVFSNNVMIGGHTTIGDHVIVGGGAGIHQFCNIGHHAFVGGIAAVVHDVIPYGMVVGNRAHMAGLNLVGMKRSGMAKDEINALRHAYKELFSDNGRTLRENARRLKEDYAGNDAVIDIADFILVDSKRKFTTPMTARRMRQEDGDE